MDSFNPSCLPGERYVVFVVSTMGQGDPPDSMKDFWKYLPRKHLGARWLEGLHYAVFGLGDSSYAKYNVTNQRLTKGDSDRDVRHFELEDLCSPISYQVGDDLEILPSQNPSAVDAFIKRCNLDPECFIMIRAKGGDKVSKGSPMNSSMDPIKLKTFVALAMDVASASPRRYFFEIMSYFAKAEEKKKLQQLTSPEGRDSLYWDQPQKVYVQDKIRGQGARVFNMVCSEAAIYVAVSSTRMPADVTAALEEVFCQRGGVPEKDVSRWVMDMKRAGKFIAETWS